MGRGGDETAEGGIYGKEGEKEYISVG